MKCILSCLIQWSSRKVCADIEEVFEANENDGRSLSHTLADFLLSYRITPHGTTNSSPSQLFLKRSLRTRFDLLMSPTKGFVESKQAEQKERHD